MSVSALAASDLFKLVSVGNQLFFVRVIWLSRRLDIKRLFLPGFKGGFRPGHSAELKDDSDSCLGRSRVVASRSGGLHREAMPPARLALDGTPVARLSLGGLPTMLCARPGLSSGFAARLGIASRNEDRVGSRRYWPVLIEQIPTCEPGGVYTYRRLSHVNIIFFPKFFSQIFPGAALARGRLSLLLRWLRRYGGCRNFCGPR